MPDRILRDELLESERWLALPDNTCRLAFVCLIPKGDALGNMEGSEARLWHLWRDPLALTDRKQVARIADELSKADLARPYKAGDRQLIHIPRYRQRLRYLGRIFPPSPWTTDEEKQLLAKNSPGAHLTVTGRAPAEVKRSEVKRSEVLLPNVVQNPHSTARANEDHNNVVEKKNNGKTDRWDASDQGIDRKGHELGLNPKPGESYFDFKQRLWQIINARSRKA